MIGPRRLLVLLALVAACGTALIHVKPARLPVAQVRNVVFSAAFVWTFTVLQLSDDQGRERIFHGVNVVYKVPPYYPSNGPFSPDTSLNNDDIAFLQKNGLNVIRLYVAWPGVEPQRGQYNTEYLAAVKDIVDRLAQADIYTILDCHQDLFSPKFCGEGAPDFAALYENASVPVKPFPEPIATAFAINATSGYPVSGACGSKPFFYFIFSDAVCKSFQSLYDNEQHILDHFVEFWRQVAQQFVNSTHVLGYELLNEPWAGDIYTHPEQLYPHIADKRNLEPMYTRLHEAIRTVDNQHILFFEPTVIITQLPLVKFSRTGLEQGPGGPAYNDRQVYAYHDYCQLLTADGQPLNAPICSAIDKDTYFKTKTEDMKALGTAGFLTEWGALNNGTGVDHAYAQDLLSHTDAHMQSWAYWAFKSYHDITTQAREPSGEVLEGLWDSKGQLDVAKLKLLTYTYPQAVAGNLTNFTFDWASADFTLNFLANVSIAAPTIIFVNVPLYYPDGLDVSVVPHGVLQYQVDSSSNQVMLTYTSGIQMHQSIMVQVKRK